MHRGWHQLLVLFLIFPLLVQAETRVFTEFVYDASGNIIGIQRDVGASPPIVNNLNPSIVRIGQTFLLTATGTDLRSADITPQDDTVIISNINAGSESVTFNVFAGAAGPLGAYTLTFTTPLGTTVIPPFTT